MSFTISQKYGVDFYIIDMGEHDMIVGMEFLVKNHMIIDYEGWEISLKHTYGINHA